MKHRLFLLLFCLAQAVLFSQKQPLSYFLPEGNYDPAVPTPEQFLGWQIGEWHVSHDQIVGYMKELDRASDRISLEVYGHSHERRPMLLLTISSKENQANILKIRETLNAQMAPRLKSDLIFQKQEGVPSLILDLKDVKFVDSSGLSAILTAHRLWKGESSFVLTGIVHPSVKKLIEISRLDSILAITSDVKFAIEHVNMERLERELAGGVA